MEKMVFQHAGLFEGLTKTIALLHAADKVYSPLSSSFGLSVPYLGFVFRLRALKPAIMAVRVS